MSQDRLRKLLGMLGSEYDGERANAARMIAKMAKDNGKGIADFVMSPQTVYRDRIVEKPVYRDPPSDPDVEAFKRGFDEEWARRHQNHPYTRKKGFDHSRRASERARRGNTIIAGLRWAADYPEHLTGYEVEFIDSILSKGLDDVDLSPKQEKVARRIILKVQTYEDGEPLI